jgi:hypothetical protein
VIRKGFRVLIQARFTRFVSKDSDSDTGATVTRVILSVLDVLVTFR